ncbi:MAG: hypothetical protein IPP53_15270 [Bacteroidetes bacterium]|nr:hypothetical protein [Bacteroidota bacterium]
MTDITLFSAISCGLLNCQVWNLGYSHPVISTSGIDQSGAFLFRIK